MNLCGPDSHILLRRGEGWCMVLDEVLDAAAVATVSAVVEVGTDIARATDDVAERRGAVAEVVELDAVRAGAGEAEPLSARAASEPLLYEAAKIINIVHIVFPFLSSGNGGRANHTPDCLSCISHHKQP